MVKLNNPFTILFIGSSRQTGLDQLICRWPWNKSENNNRISNLEQQISMQSRCQQQYNMRSHKHALIFTMSKIGII